MKKSDNSPSGFRKMPAESITRVLAVLVALLVGLIVLAGVSGFIAPFIDAAFRLTAGFVFFLRDKLPRMSWNAATWIPGLAAFLAALLLIHRPLKRWAVARGRMWSGTSTFCLGLLLPLLFAISFLIPGAILQVRLLAQDDLVHASRTTTRHLAANAMKMIHLDLLERSGGTGRFPDSLSDDPRDGFLHLDDPPGSVPEPFLYPGAGLSIDCDPSTPIVVSPPHMYPGGWKRLILTAGGDLIILDADRTGFD